MLFGWEQFNGISGSDLGAIQSELARRLSTHGGIGVSETDEPVETRGEAYERMRREQSDWEDWQPNDCDFWTGEGDEDSGD